MRIPDSCASSHCKQSKRSMVCKTCAHRGELARCMGWDAENQELHQRDRWIDFQKQLEDLLYEYRACIKGGSIEFDSYESQEGVVQGFTVPMTISP